MNSLIEDVSEDQFIVQLDPSNDSSAQRTKTNTKAGTSSMAETGTKRSSKNPARDLTRPLKLLPDICRNNNLVTTTLRRYHL